MKSWTKFILILMKAISNFYTFFSKFLLYVLAFLASLLNKEILFKREEDREAQTEFPVAGFFPPV